MRKKILITGGAGYIGSHVVENLLKSDYEIIVIDSFLFDKHSLKEHQDNKKLTIIKEDIRNLQKIENIFSNVDTVIHLAALVGEAACKQDLVITMLQNHEQVNQCCMQPGGVFDSIESMSGIYLDCSTVSITASRELHAQAKKRNILMLDAPVSGGVAAAKAGQLTFMVGGDEAVYTQVQSILLQMGKAAIYAGGPGNGTAAKICNNMILGISMIAVSESFNLANALGLSEQTLFDICSKASGQCWSLTSYCPAPGVLDNVPSSNNYKPGFAAAMMLKDLNLAQEASEKMSVSSVLGRQAKELYEKFVGMGNADKDFSAIIKMLSD